MPNYTPNYNLTKPLDTELYDIEVQNKNMDIIDEVLLNTNKNYSGQVDSTHTFDDTLTQGEYFVTGTNLKGAPRTGNIYGKLIVIVNTGTTHYGSGYWTWQIFYEANDERNVFIRQKVNEQSFTEWTSFVLNSELNATLFSYQKHFDGSIVDFDSALTRGKYFVSGTDLAGAPYTGNSYGVLFVFLATDKSEWTGVNTSWLNQIFIDTKQKIWFRQRINSDNFTNWTQIYTTYNKPSPDDIGAVKKSGDVMTGSLTVPWLHIKREGSDYPSLEFKNANGVRGILIQPNLEDGVRQLVIYQYPSAFDNAETKYREAFRLPAPSDDLTGNESYSILTSKTPVTVKQGGTGATTATDARKKLGAVSQDEAFNATFNNSINQNILSLDVPYGVHWFEGDATTANNWPFAKSDARFMVTIKGIIYTGTQGYRVIELHDMSTGDMWVNHYHWGNWFGWKKVAYAT